MNLHNKNFLSLKNFHFKIILFLLIILYISLFFHDLGKGRGLNHAVVSSKIAKRFCSFIKLNKIETNTIDWLIKNHLLMNKVSQRLDLEDPKTIIEFVKKIYSSVKNIKIIKIL